MDRVGRLIKDSGQSEEYEDLMEAGVIDPTKVVRTALENAVTVAMLTGLELLERRLEALAPGVHARGRGDDGS